MRVLLLLPAVPFPPTTGQKHRFALVARRLAERHDVAIACFAAPGDNEGLQDVAHLFAALRSAPLQAPLPGTDRRAWLSRDPSEIAYFRSPEMAQHVDDLVRRFDPQVVIVGDPALTPYVARFSDPVRVLDNVCEVMLQSDRWAASTSGATRLLWRLRRLKYAHYLERISRFYDLCIVNSREDLVSLARVWPARRLRLVTNGLDLALYPTGLAAPIPNRMIYPGSLTYEPNRDAVAWFAASILPAIRARLPDAELVVTGPIPTKGLLPQADGLRYIGFVDDVKTEIARAAATVVPLRLGAGGARFKVLESLALGTPVVSTAIGYEGLEVADPVTILKAEDPETFAARTTELLGSPDLRERIARNGRRLMEDVYNWDKLGAVFEAELVHLYESRFGLAA